MSNEVRIQYLTDDGLSVLKGSFDDNLSKYKSNDQKYFIDMLTKHNYLLDSSYVIEDFSDKLVFTSNKDADDFENIKVVYESMRNIPSYVMMDDRFWAGINHTIMWSYIMKRRDGEAFGTNISGQRDKIYNSFFTHTKHGKKRGTYVNCVSRLWWAGKLTYEENEHNHYELTEELCKKGFPSTILLFSSSNIMSRNESRKAILTVVKSLRGTGQDVKRNDIVAGIRYMNLVAGSTLIDLIPYFDLLDMLTGFYKKYYNI